jgi:hypothetical protein
MFLDNSRYARLATVTVIQRDGSTVAAVKLRRLPPTSGDPHVVIGIDRLDIMAQRQYADGTRFWHIADANSELQANDLVRTPGRVIAEPAK